MPIHSLPVHSSSLSTITFPLHSPALSAIGAIPHSPQLSISLTLPIQSLSPSSISCRCRNPGASIEPLPYPPQLITSTLLCCWLLFCSAFVLWEMDDYQRRISHYQNLQFFFFIFSLIFNSVTSSLCSLWNNFVLLGIFRFVFLGYSGLIIQRLWYLDCFNSWASN